MKQLLYILIFTASLNGMAQYQTTFIFSKMDIEAQHILWDNTPTMLMGFTSTMSGNIDIPCWFHNFPLSLTKTQGLRFLLYL